MSVIVSEMVLNKTSPPHLHQELFSHTAINNITDCNAGNLKPRNIALWVYANQRFATKSQTLRLISAWNKCDSHLKRVAYLSDVGPRTDDLQLIFGGRSHGGYNLVQGETNSTLAV